jgi:hypothetical protein
VGAGDGSLSYFLSRALAARHPDISLELFASDLEPYNPEYAGRPGTADGYKKGDKSARIFPVTAEDFKLTLEKRKPALVLCAWMPMNIDWSAHFRKTRTVEEYILIGMFPEIIPDRKMHARKRMLCWCLFSLHLTFCCLLLCSVPLFVAYYFATFPSCRGG